ERYVVEGGNTALLENSAILLKRVANSLVVAGRSEQLAIVERAHQELMTLLPLSEEQISNRLKSIADLLVQVETGLYAWLYNGGQPDDGRAMAVDSAQDTVVSEIRAGLETIKESVVEFIASEWNMSTLEGVPQKLHDVSGALGMLAQPRAATIMDACHRFLV